MSSPLVTTAWLEEHLKDRDIRIIEIRGKVLPPTDPPPHYFTDRAGYEAAHIPNAVFVDWQVDIVEPGSPSNDVASPQRFSELMEGLGISNDSCVVVSDDAASMFACRLRWALRYYGHEKVYVLDGGWSKWLAEGRPVSSEIPHFEPRRFVPKVNLSLKATTQDILRGLEAESLQLVDVRSPAEYAGVASRARHGGRIPTAVNLPRKTMVADDMTLKPAAELRLLLHEKGIDFNSPDTVLYCNSGVSATVGMLAMEVAGAENLRIYDGSWKEWGNEDSTPKAI
ncbi:MAG: sulfurtransferase [Chloroflexi bacterium]|nr:sulfurtransferase [Chloroflexota bacterium]